jgi:hypothetical protein
MQKPWISIFLLAAANSYCQEWRNPEVKFDTKANMVNTVTITWHAVRNVQEICEKTSREKGFGGFGYSVDACSFWSSAILGNQCEIYTGKKTTMHELGHEIRHCFQGSFHPTPK